MACRFSPFCFVFVAVVCCGSLNLVAQGNRHSVFPTRLDAALGLQSSSANSFRSVAGVARERFTQGSALDSSRATRSSLSSTSPSESQMGASVHRRVTRATEAAGDNQANLSDRPFVNASYRIRRAIDASNAPSETSKTVDPSAGFGTVMTFPAKPEAGAKIIVHQSDSMSGNEYAFIVENVGSETAEPFSVEFTTPPEITVVTAFPFNAEQSPHAVVVNFERLGAGQRSPVHIKTSSARQNDFMIETRIRTEKEQALHLKAEQSTGKSNGQNAIPDTDGNDTEVFYQLFDEDSTLPRDPSPTDNSSKAVARSILDSTPPTDLNTQLLLTSSLAGPESLVAEQEQDYEITITNPSDVDATEIIVQLTLPRGLMVVKLDRAAWIDQPSRTISWKLDSLGALEMNTIRYRVKAIGAGDQLQRVVVGMNDIYQGEVRMTSSIITTAD